MAVPKSMSNTKSAICAIQKNKTNISKNNDNSNLQDNIPLGTLKKKNRSEIEEPVQKIVNLLHEMQGKVNVSRLDIQQ